MKLGILGGTFNPVHSGHLMLAECAREQMGLDQVWFVPAAKPPHKNVPDLLRGDIRLTLIKLAIQANPFFKTSDLELRLGGVSYTVRTLRYLKKRYPSADLFFIVGSDMLRIPWVGLEELGQICTFVVADRAPKSRIHKFPKMKWLAMPRVEISSSLIRAKIKQGKSIRYLVPDSVARYIIRRRLFRGGK